MNNRLLNHNYLKKKTEKNLKTSFFSQMNQGGRRIVDQVLQT